MPEPQSPTGIYARLLPVQMPEERLDALEDAANAALDNASALGADEGSEVVAYIRDAHDLLRGLMGLDRVAMEWGDADEDEEADREVLYAMEESELGVLDEDDDE